MKRIKKLASLMLAMVMAMAMTVTAFAADNNPYQITVKQTIEDKTEHQYAAYQIFAGDLSTDENDKLILSNIIWGSGVENTDALLAELKADTDDVFSGVFADCETAADVAKALSEFNSTDRSETGALDYFARIVENHLSAAYESKTGTGDVVIDVVGAGYYLIRDIKDSVEPNGAYTRVLLEVVGNAEANVKSEVPHGDKQVYIDGETTGDANNSSIGSHVSYEITSKVPNWAGYNYYYFIMNDTLSDGLTLDYDLLADPAVNSFHVTVGGEELTKDTDYYIYTGTEAGSYTFRLAFADIRNYEVGADIVVTYSATVNENAVIGTTGNPNTWTLQYSNNPSDTFDHDDRPDDTNKPGLPADEENEPFGVTPEEKTLTYVTELDITKYANEIGGKLLEGAEFTLTGTSKQVVLKDVVYYREATENEEGEWYLLKDGTYTTTAPTGTAYVEIGVGTAETDKGYILRDGAYVVPEDKDDYIGETIYKLVRGTNEQYVDVNTKYVQDTKQETTYVDVNVSMELTTDENGVIKFQRLGAGEYTLTETVTPEGFNTLEPINFTITFTAPDRGVVHGEETCIWDISSDSLVFTEGGNDQSVGGVFAADIINQSGSLLPSTGGIGTTIFYVVGGILVVAAGILLVTKKRMSAR